MLAFISLIACQVPPPCALSRSLLATRFAFLLSHVALELLTTFRRSFLQCQSLCFRALLDASLVLLLYASFLRSIASKSLVSFSENQSGRFLSPLGWRSRVAFFYEFREDVKGLPFGFRFGFGFREEGIDGFSEINPFLWARKKFPLELLFVLYLFGS
jgi:hypothetical protein